ncbi:MAG: hypothetical protein CM1200mP2_40150 [Planctomycetaceae bacterium]|nr:MAG: hypothetical protein CM1200mP2_40150 [Planctomycetaceae bacterium]
MWLHGRGGCCGLRGTGRGTGRRQVADSCRGAGKGRFAEEPEQPGVVLVRSADEAREHAPRMIGNTLVTIQTGEGGKTVKTLFVEEG